MSNLLETALRYYRAGHRVVPVKSDKRPTTAWKPYQTAQTEEDVRRDFAADHWGIAILTGINGLEVIDIDCKYDLTGALEVDFFKASDELNNNAPAVVALMCQATKSGGYHVMYRCPEPGGNRKLASRPPAPNEDQNTTPVLIETRGIGGYVVVAPSPGYDVQFGDLENIPYITQATRDTILTAARSFDELPEVEQVYVPRRNFEVPTTGKTPWDDYNDRVDCVDLLIKHGWTVVYTQGEKVYMKRPGKTDAKTSGNYHTGRQVFVSHTTSTPLPAEKGLTAYSICKYYEHGGDASACARALYAAGYGERKEARQEQPAPAPLKPATPEEQKQEEDTLMKSVWATKFDYFAPVKEEDAILMHYHKTDDNRVKPYKVAGYGQLGAIVGEQKSGKTFVLRHLVASALSGGKECLTFSLAIPANKNILWVDTEQSEYFYKITQKELQDLAGVQNPPQYFAFHLRKYSVAERVKVLKKLVEEIPDLGLIIVDGIVDLCPDFNDTRHSSETMQQLMSITDGPSKPLLLTVLHVTKKDGFMRGHLGTALQNKCDFALEVSKDPVTDWYKVRSRESRFAPFPIYAFCRDNETGRAIGTEQRTVAAPYADEVFPAPDNNGAMAAHRPGADLDLPF
jgi:hypothetical protein